VISPRGKRIFAWLMAALMALMLIVPTVSLVAQADEYSDGQAEIDALSDQYKDLQQQQKEIQRKLSLAQGEKKKLQAVQQELNNQLNTTLSQIEVLNERIEHLNRNIAVKEEELAEKQAAYDETYALFKQRFRAMTAAQNTSTLGLVLGADNFSEVLTRTEVSTRIAQYDREIMDRLAAERQELEEVKEIIETSKRLVEEDKGELDSKREDLSVQEAEARNRVHDVSALEQQFMANKEEMQKKMAAVQAEINEIYREINKTSTKIPYVGGEMQWPSNVLTGITSNFGSRFGGSDYHTGIDIAGNGAYGTPVLAANTGTVVVANTKPNEGYGTYVIIDHGGGIQTLYGHCSRLTVSVGDVVATGQKIAEVGSTGWATGPHIHFEVRVNGSAKNPISYLGG
jgi:murein DD-endopeptidase MepM/ murein hydrolase activator NlpD